MPSDRVTEAAGELYAADPAVFMQRRKALADAARADGDREAAKRITALRKPTRVAWILNRLSRADPGTPGRLETLAASLRAAAQAKDGRRLRELSAARGELIDALTSQALAAAEVTDPPAGLREEVAATLTSAFADPEIGRQFAAGTLTRAAQWAGFGLAPVADTPDSDTPDSGTPDSATPDSGTGAGAALGTGAASGTGTASDMGAGAALGTGAALDTGTTSGTGADSDVGAAGDEDATSGTDREPAPAAPRAEKTAARTARRPASSRAPRPTAAPPKAPQAPRRAEVPEDAQARRRKAFDDAERSLVAAAQAAAAAVSAEDHLEATVRDLEERLTTARAALADARLRARRAESAERKARQARDRLPRP